MNYLFVSINRCLPFTYKRLFYVNIAYGYNSRDPFTFGAHIGRYLTIDTSNVVFQGIDRSWIVPINERLHVSPQKWSSGDNTHEPGSQLSVAQREING